MYLSHVAKKKEKMNFDSYVENSVLWYIWFSHE